MIRCGIMWISGAAQGLPRGGRVLGLLRPETVDVVVADGAADEGGLTGDVVSKIFLGAVTRVRVEDGDRSLVADLSTSRAAPLAVFCDFDGTFSVQDVGATLAKIHAGDRRPAAWARYERGETQAPAPLVKLLRLVDQHPELLSEIGAL